MGETRPSIKKSKNFVQYLICQVLVGFCIDLIDIIKWIINLKDEIFFGRFFMSKSITAILKTLKN